MRRTLWIVAAVITVVFGLMLLRPTPEAPPAASPSPSAPAVSPSAPPIVPTTTPRTAPTPAAAAPAPLEPVATRTVRWKIIPGECPIPRDGSVMRIGRHARPPDREARMEGEWLVGDGFPAEYGVYLATADDGSLASLFLPPAPKEPWDPVSFVRPRKVEIVLRDEDGNPVEAVGVGLGGHGRDHDARVVPLVDGRAVYDGLFPSEHGCRLWLLDEFNRDGDGYGLGVVDVSKGDARLEQVVPRPREIVLRVRIDGRPAVPGKFNLLAGLDPAIHREVDSAAGEIRFRIRPHYPGLSTLQLNWWAGGHRPDQAAIVAKCDTPGGTYRAELDLATGPDLGLIARVRGAPDPAGLSVDIQTSGGWAPAVSGEHPAADGTLRVGGLGPGRYRLRDPATGVTSDPVDLAADSKTPEATLDIPPVAIVKGRVHAPEGTRWKDVRVLVEGPGVDTSIGDPFLRYPGRAVHGDLAFEVPVPADRTVTLRAWHPVLASATGKLPATATGAADGIVLRLVEERVAVFHPAPEEVGSGWFRVLLFSGEPAGDPVAERNVLLVDGVARFGGFAAGRYTLWFDTWKFAPKIVPEVELSGGRTDLGEIRFETGTVLTVHLKVPDGSPWPGFDAAAVPLAGPAFTRWDYANRDTQAAVLPGLRAGKYRVRVRLSGIVAELMKEVEVDGVSPAAIDFDLK